MVSLEEHGQGDQGGSNLDSDGVSKNIGQSFEQFVKILEALRFLLPLGRGLHPLIESNVQVLYRAFKPRVDKSHFKPVHVHVLPIND